MLSPTPLPSSLRMREITDSKPSSKKPVPQLHAFKHYVKLADAQPWTNACDKRNPFRHHLKAFSIGMTSALDLYGVGYKRRRPTTLTAISEALASDRLCVYRDLNASYKKLAADAAIGPNRIARTLATSARKS
jgi:hypothetical protein